MLRFLRAATLTGLVALSASAASAAEPEPPRRWYGGQTLATDGATAALFIAAILNEGSPTLFGLSAATYLIGAPIVHVANGEGAHAALSVMVRVASPLVIGAIATEIIRSEPSSCRYQSYSTDCAEDRQMQNFAGMLIGGTIGAVAASVTDAAALAWKPGARPPVTIAPQVGADRFTVSVLGTF